MLSTGCSPPPHYNVDLFDQDEGAVGDPVYIDDEEAGTIEKIVPSDGNWMAVVRIDGDYVEQVRSGIYREPDQGQIRLATTEVTPDASELEAGSMILLPTGAKSSFFQWIPDDIMERFGRGSTVIAAVVCILGLIILFLLFRLIFRIGFVTAVLALSVLLAAASHHLAIPLVEAFYEATYAEDRNGPSRLEVPQTSVQGEAEEASSGIGAWIESVIAKPPHPAYVSFGCVALLYFLLLTTILGRAIKSFRKPKE